ncbi:MAG: glutathionylspermidine synthase family protein [Bacteroidota bacterium]
MLKTFLSQKPDNFLQNSGWDWTTADTSPYISDYLIQVSENEANKYYEATAELYEMFINSAEHVIKTKNYQALGIPKSLIPMIEYSWENDDHWHLYGRFDLSGGLDGKPIKLIEFNADTATCLPETAIIQWASLMANNLSENKQFNTLLESLTYSFSEIKKLNSNLEPAILFSSMSGFPEDSTNVTILKEAASLAGFQVDTEYIEEVEFSKTEGIFKKNQPDNYSNFPFWFKLIPWEFIAEDEPELVEILTELVLGKKIVVLNPAYTLLFQSKGILKILWDLYPNHPLLLETKFEPIYGKKSVKKVLFGREGSNISIVSSYGIEIKHTDGDYSKQISVYQEFTEFIKDENQYLQAGVFFSSEPCGLGFRKGGEIIDNKAIFCGHHIS